MESLSFLFNNLSSFWLFANNLAAFPSLMPEVICACRGTCNVHCKLLTDFYGQEINLSHISNFLKSLVKEYHLKKLSWLTTLSTCQVTFMGKDIWSVIMEVEISWYPTSACTKDQSKISFLVQWRVCLPQTVRSWLILVIKDFINKDLLHIS